LDNQVANTLLLGQLVGQLVGQT